MRLVSTIFVLLIILTYPLQANDVIFRSLQFSAVTSINLDTALAYDAIWNYGAEEKNIIVKLYINNMPLTLGIDCAMNIALVWGTSKLYNNKKKWGKPLAYAIIIAVNLVQAYILYEHYQFRKGLR